MKRVAIIGSGIVGTALAYHLAEAGCQVDIFENGPETPYPHTPQYEVEVLYANPYAPPAEFVPTKLPPDIKGIVQAGDYGRAIDDERIMCVGGQATRWFGITPRLHPDHFKPKTLHGYGVDWPIGYGELESYYCRAEAYLGISGQVDNPFAGPRSRPFPLPAFELGYEDQLLAAQLRAAGLITHTTSQARVRHDHDGRPGCQNFGVCETCPIGARYSPNHHLDGLRASPRVRLHSNALVRRILIENDRARGIVFHPDHAHAEQEHGADIIIVAAGAIESARLLLLSASGGGVHRNGLGNASGQVGRNFGMHHIWWSELTFPRPVMPGRAGPPTLLSHQFIHPEGQGRGGGTTVELFDGIPQHFFNHVGRQHYADGSEALEALKPIIHRRSIAMNAETIPDDAKFIALSDRRDRFGDPFAAFNYKLSDFDHATYQRTCDLAQRFAKALEVEDIVVAPIEQFWSAHHHLGSCRMGASARDSVVDSFGAVHETKGLYVCGGATFPTVTPLQPTLTMVALAIRSAERIAEELKSQTMIVSD